MLRFIGVQELNMIRGDGDFDTISIWKWHKEDEGSN
jgi:hypothetical protein